MFLPSLKIKTSYNKWFCKIGVEVASIGNFVSEIPNLAKPQDRYKQVVDTGIEPVFALLK